ncbi:hypothetical protein [Streptomyces sp. NPDC056975]|uniref:hypothetical protein n=1 Tax=unclassified Streptomyces TaxID=2593676 RepID=UPI00363B91D8
MPYAVPQPLTPSAAEPGTVYTVASGDLRAAADITGWPSRQKLEADLTAALTDLGRTVRRAHAVDEKKGHGFIDCQRAGIEVFKQLPPDAPLIVVEGANNCCGMHSRISTNVFFSLTLGVLVLSGIQGLCLLWEGSSDLLRFGKVRALAVEVVEGASGDFQPLAGFTAGDCSADLFHDA